MTLRLTTLDVRIRGSNRIPMSQLNDSQRDIATGTLYDRAECITGTAQAICYGIRKVHRRKRRKYLIHLAEDAFRILNAVCTQQVEGVATTFGCNTATSIYAAIPYAPSWSCGTKWHSRYAATLMSMV